MKNYLFCFIILVSGLYSCKKMLSSIQKPQPSGQNANTEKITRIVRLDSDYYSNKFVYEEYRYDNMNRVTRYIKYEVDSGNRSHPPVIDTDHVITFDYTDYPGVPTNPGYPSYSSENYRASSYYLVNATHRYYYDNQNRMVLDTLIDFYTGLGGTDRGVTVSRRIRYNASSIVVDNLNLDTYTSIKGHYRDSIVLDSRGNPINTTTLNGKFFVTGNLDDFNISGFLTDNYAYSNIQNPLNDMNVSNVMAFVQTGFPGGVFYASYLAKNSYSSWTESGPSFNPVTTNFQYVTSPLNNAQISKVVFSRQGASQHGGYEVFTYNTQF